MKTKIIIVNLKYSSSAELLVEKLNAEGADGWRATQFSSSIHQKNDEHWIGKYYIVLEKSTFNYCYRCVIHRSGGSKEVDGLNSAVEEQEKEDYAVVQIVHSAVIKVSEYPTNYKGLTFVIFERQLD